MIKELLLKKRRENGQVEHNEVSADIIVKIAGIVAAGNIEVSFDSFD